MARAGARVGMFGALLGAHARARPRPLVARGGVRARRPGLRRVPGPAPVGARPRASTRWPSTACSPARACPSTSPTPSATSSSAWPSARCSSARCAATALASTWSGARSRVAGIAAAAALALVAAARDATGPRGGGRRLLGRARGALHATAPRTPTAASAAPAASPPTQLHSGWAVLGLAAAGRDPRRRAAQRALGRRLHGRAGTAGYAGPPTSSARSWRWSPRGARRARCAGATSSPSSCAGAGATAPSPGRSRSRRSASTRCAPPAARRSDPVVRAAAALGRARAERRRRLQLRYAAAGRAAIDDTAAALQGLAAAGPARSHGGRARGHVPARPSRTPTAACRSATGGASQRSVDGLGGPGPAWPRGAIPTACAAAAGAPRCLSALAADHHGRRPLHAHERPDPGVGHRPGADRPGAQPFPIAPVRRRRARMRPCPPRAPRRRPGFFAMLARATGILAAPLIG